MSSLSRYAIVTVLPWLCLAPFQYGYAVSQLNQIQHALTCNSSQYGRYNLPVCIPMDDASFGLVTSIFTIGGLLASLFANRIADPYGRKRAVQLNAVAVGLGSLVLAIASSVFMLTLGRFLIGLGAGLGLCVIPPFLSEIAPPKIRDSVGVLNQVAVVFGILATQILGLYFAEPGSWRIVFIISFMLSVLQFLMGLRNIESPAWLAIHNRKPEARAVSAKLWTTAEASTTGGAYEDDDIEEALLRQSEPLPSQQDHPPASIAQSFKIPELRRPLLIVVLSMFAQQVSGINAVMYYSTGILSNALPDAASYVSLGVAVVNVIMTFPPIFFVERLGKRKLLLWSTWGSILSLALLGLSLNYNFATASAVGTLVFVSCFAFGMGPIPFIIIPDVSPLYAVSSLSSIAISVNWITNFFIGLAFLPLSNYLAGPDRAFAGNVFFLFAVLLTLTSVVFFRYF